MIPLPSAFPGLEMCGACPCEGYRPCGDGVDSCYRLSERCDGVVHCGATGADEAGCDVTPPDVVLPEGPGASVAVPLFADFQSPGASAVDAEDPYPLLRVTNYRCLPGEDTFSQALLRPEGAACAALLARATPLARLAEEGASCTALGPGEGVSTSELALFLQVYRATDASGNEATPQARCVQVYDTCYAVTYTAADGSTQHEYTCEPPAVCSTFGVCLGDEEEEEELEIFVPILDTTAPVLTPLPEGIPVEVIGDAKVVKTTVLQSDPYVDPGAFEWRGGKPRTHPCYH